MSYGLAHSFKIKEFGIFISRFGVLWRWFAWRWSGWTGSDMLTVGDDKKQDPQRKIPAVCTFTVAEDPHQRLCAICATDKRGDVVTIGYKCRGCGCTRVQISLNVIQRLLTQHYPTVALTNEPDDQLYLALKSIHDDLSQALFRTKDIRKRKTGEKVDDKLTQAVTSNEASGWE